MSKIAGFELLILENCTTQVIPQTAVVRKLPPQQDHDPRLVGVPNFMDRLQMLEKTIVEGPSVVVFKRCTVTERAKAFQKKQHRCHIRLDTVCVLSDVVDVDADCLLL